MKRKGASILFVNPQRQVLLFLRDDLPHIPYPNTWDVPGGHVEEGETPAECIIREMKEEIGLDLEGFELLSVKEFSDRVEYTFWKSADLNIDAISLQEGQRLQWFSEEEAGATPLAYGFNEIVQDFYARAPFI
jgi:8-oxo-dGTP diphosphatase